MDLAGGCFCGQIRYSIKLGSPDEARMSICHCKNCKKFTGSAFGITAKIPRKAFTVNCGKPVVYEDDNGTGTILHREFCGICGSSLLEYGEHAGDNTYIFYGTLDNPEALPPKGEFFCKQRASWQPEIPGIFHKQELHE